MMTLFDKHHPSDEGIRFMNGFLRHPQQVGSVLPSSRYLKQHIVELAEIHSARSVVELGPGTGGTSRALLESMRSDAKLLTIEINPDFVTLLNRIHDPRLVVQLGDAQDLIKILAQQQMPPPDVIVSGIPFSTMAETTGMEIILAIARSLAKGGRFLAYQFRGRVEKLATPVFGPAHVEFELRNIPPLYLYCWRKSAGWVI